VHVCVGGGSGWLHCNRIEGGVLEGGSREKAREEKLPASRPCKAEAAARLHPESNSAFPLNKTSHSARKTPNATPMQSRCTPGRVLLLHVLRQPLTDLQACSHRVVVREAAGVFGRRLVEWGMHKGQRTGSRARIELTYPPP